MFDIPRSLNLAVNLPDQARLVAGNDVEFDLGSLSIATQSLCGWEIVAIDAAV